MKVVRLTEKYLDDIIEITKQARNFMKKSNHSVQWTDEYPSRQTFLDDIKNNFGYVVLENNIVAGYFALCSGIDKSYIKTYDGPFKLEGPYTVIHRVMISDNFRSKGLSKKLLENAVKISKELGINIVRIDTHRDNKIMQKAILSSGFSYASIIKVEDGSERLAYEREV